MSEQDVTSEPQVDVYRELQQHIDTLPIGYPPTKSGVEIRLLKQVFNPEEAKIASNLKYSYIGNLEPLDSIHSRLKALGFKYTKEELGNHLENIAKKGGIQALKKGDQRTYGNALFILGIFEYQVNKMTKQFAEDMEQYMREALLMDMAKVPIGQLRTIPVGITIDYEVKVASFDDILNLIENIEGPIGLIECVCRQAKHAIGHTCETTSRMETCMAFGSLAKMYLDLGWSREISRVEAIEILKKNEEDGLVIQPGNSQKTDFICSCCSCCCENLSNIKLFPTPADIIATNHYAEIDSDTCAGCGTCIDRCPMDAITLDDDVSSVIRKRCIGCGNCVGVCPEEAIKLLKKDKQIVPPETPVELYDNIMSMKTKVLKAEHRRKARLEKRAIK